MDTDARSQPVSVDEFLAALSHIRHFKEAIVARKRPDPIHRPKIIEIGHAIVRSGIALDNSSGYLLLTALMAVNMVSKEKCMPRKESPATRRKDELFSLAYKADGVAREFIGGNLVLKVGIYCSRMPIRQAYKAGILKKRH